MENNSSDKKNKTRRPQEVATQKLDFLLDTIDTEVANLAETVVTQGPILYETAPNDEGSAMGFNHETTARDYHDLDMALFAGSDEPQSGNESVAKETEAALDALRDAEDEVKGMLTPDGLATDAKNGAVAAPGQDVEDQGAADALVELAATRELQSSSLPEKAEEQGEVSAEPSAVDDNLSEDLFSDLHKPSASEEGTNPTSESLPAAASDGELATLMSNKIEALLTRLVEERLPAIAERIIVERLDKIIAAMK